MANPGMGASNPNMAAVLSQLQQGGSADIFGRQPPAPPPSGGMPPVQGQNPQQPMSGFLQMQGGPQPQDLYTAMQGVGPQKPPQNAQTLQDAVIRRGGGGEGVGGPTDFYKPMGDMAGGIAGLAEPNQLKMWNQDELNKLRNTATQDMKYRNITDNSNIQGPTSYDMENAQGRVTPPPQNQLPRGRTTMAQKVAAKKKAGTWGKK